MAHLRHNRRLVAALILGLTLTACGVDEPNEPSSASAATTATTAATTASTMIETTAAPSTTPAPSSTTSTTSTTSTVVSTTGVSSSVVSSASTTEVVEPADSLPDEATMTQAAQDAVDDYLTYLADGDYLSAAQLLGEGGLSWDERFDISVLPGEPQSLPELADALNQWCDTGALCSQPTSITGRIVDDWDDVDLTVTWGSGDDAPSATIAGYTWEGAPGVVGLPPLVGEQSVALLADAVGASAAVVELSDGRVVAWSDGTIAQIPVAADSHPWSDGNFVYWLTYEDGEHGVVDEHSTVADLNGTIVCEAPGSIHLVRRNAEGTYVASVERAGGGDVVPVDGESPIPNFAVDCATGESQPIETTGYWRDGGSRSVRQIAGRSFNFLYDAEGNAQVINEAGLSINGDDYAGLHTFSPDATHVVYGDYGVGVSPHTTRTIRARDTTTGDLLWSFELPRVFASLQFTDNYVLAELPPAASEYAPWQATESIVILDATTGLQVASLPTTTQLRHVS